MSKNMKIPELRFKEFSGEWEEKTLSELGSFKNGLNKSKEDFGFGYPFINLMDVFGKDILNFKKLDLVNANKKDLESYNLNKGDILFIRSSVKRDGVGETVLVLEDLEKTTYSGFLIRFRDNKDLLELNYKRYCFKTRKFRNDLLSLSTTSANTNINQESLNTLKLILPSKQEQEKIASFLTQVDTKIEQLTKKAKLLSDYKKGIMQKIFSQEIRFKDENRKDYPNWEDKLLGKIADVRDGTHDSPKYYEKGYPLITSKNLLQDGSIDFENINLILEEDFNNINKRSKVDIGDILFGMIGTIGNPVIVNQDGFAIKNVALIKEVKQLLNNFLIHYLKSILIEKQFYEQNTGGTQKFIALGVIRNLKIKLPSLEEQTKIANFLSSIDTKVEQNQKALEKTKEFKKALLQQMFV